MKQEFDLLITSMISDRIGRHEILLQINQNYDKIWDRNLTLDIYSTNPIQIGVWIAKNTLKQEILSKSSVKNWKCNANPV